MTEEKLNIAIQGSKGGGGGGGNEAANTLRSAAVAQVVEVISEGPIVGPLGGAAGIYLNDTPLQNGNDESYNFERVVWDWRAGLESQVYMPGFGIGAETSVNAPVKKGLPVVRSVLDESVDAARVTILLPNGLVKFEDNGDSVGTSVELTIETRLTGGTWAVAEQVTIGPGKTTSAYEDQRLVRRPEGPLGAWEIRVARITDDPANSKIRNETTWARFTNVEETKESYDNTAVIGLKADAESFGNAYPTRAYLVKGLILDVPTNYDPDTRSYTGIWDGTFKQAWTDNPAWVLYALLTNTRWGLGEFVTRDFIDVYSFYDAAQYCDELVSYTKDGISKQEPRFSFNAVINKRTEALKLLQLVAGMMNAVLYYQGGLLRVSQDRPMATVMQFSNSNVIGGKFSYSTSSVYTRTTAVNITFSDKAQNYLSSTATVFDQDGIDRFGLNTQNIDAFGATSEAQAIRAGKWVLDTSLNQTKNLSFQASYDAFGLRIGDVISIYDEHFVGKAGEGRIVSAVGTTITLDRPITLTSSSKITIFGDGFVKQTKNISQTSGSLSVITVDSPFTNLPEQALFIIQTDVAPQLYKVVNLTETEKNIVDIKAVTYDANKFSRVETGLEVETPPYTGPNKPVVGNVTDIIFKDTSTDDVVRSLLVSWLPPLNNTIKSYNLRWRQNNGNYILVESIAGPAYEISNLQSGTVDVTVYARNLQDKVSTGTSASYTIDTTFGTGSALKPVTNLQVKGGGLTFPGRDVTIQWTNPADQETALAKLKSFYLQILNPTTDVVLHEAFVAAVAPGATQEYLFDFAKNSQTTGGPFRTFKVRVRALDNNNKTSVQTIVTLSNPAPAALTGLVILDGIGNTKLSWSQPQDTDFAGVVIWASTTSDFTPSSGNQVAVTQGNYFTHIPATLGVLWYYKLAAYDDFGFNANGSGLNIVTGSATAISNNPGVPGGTTFPSSPADGDSFFRTDLNALFFYNSAAGKWERVGNGTGNAFPTNPAPVAGDLFYLQSDGKLYRYTGTAWTAAVPAVDITGNLTSAQIASLDAAKLTGSISSTQITDGSISTPKLAAGAITTAKIASEAITAEKIQAYSIQAYNIATNAITAEKILANAITAGKIVSGAVEADKIAAGAITAGKIAAFAIETGKIAAGAITGDKISSNTITTGLLSVNGSVVTASNYNEAHGKSIPPGGYETVVEVWIDMGYEGQNLGAAGVLITAFANFVGNQNSSQYLRIIRIRDGAQLGFSEGSFSGGFTSHITVTGIDRNPVNGGNGYRLIWQSPGAGPGANVGGTVTRASIIATGGKR